MPAIVRPVLLASFVTCGLAGIGAPPAAGDQAPSRPAQAAAPAQPAAASQPFPSIPAIPPEAPPSEATLGIAVYPTAQFLRSYDAGRGQRYYLYGSAASFAEVVAYYRTILRQRGDLVFQSPATHMFEVGRYRSNTMAFPPGVTVKDYTGGGTGGYPNPASGGTPPRFPTVIQIVPIVPER